MAATTQPDSYAKTAQQSLGQLRNVRGQQAAECAHCYGVGRDSDDNKEATITKPRLMVSAAGTSS